LPSITSSERNFSNPDTPFANKVHQLYLLISFSPNSSFFSRQGDEMRAKETSLL
jgi:hypothetical protein